MDISAQKFCCRRNSTKIYTLFQSNELKFCRTKIKSSTPCKALSEAGNEGVLILFFFQRPFPVTLSSGELVRDVQNFWGTDNFFPPSNTGAGSAVCRQPTSHYDSAS